jgi:flagellar motility protein MotE (MotC chaperone)
MVEEIRLRRHQERPEPPPPPQAKRPSRTGVLALALCLGSLLLVLGAQYGVLGFNAFAQSDEVSGEESPDANSPDLLSRRPDAEWPDPQTAGMREIIDSLKARERAMERREHSLVARESDLRQVEVDLQERLEDLQVERKKLEMLLEQADEAKDIRIRAIVKMVESMRSGDAAKIIEELDNELAVSVLSRMNKTKAGKLLAAVEPRRAAFLTELLAKKPPE